MLAYYPDRSSPLLVKIGSRGVTGATALLPDEPHTIPILTERLSAWTVRLSSVLTTVGGHWELQAAALLKAVWFPSCWRTCIAVRKNAYNTCILLLGLTYGRTMLTCILTVSRMHSTTVTSANALMLLHFFGRPLRRFTLCYGNGTVVCPVCNAGVLRPNGWMYQDGGRPGLAKASLCWMRTQSPQGKGHSSPLHFSAHVYC